MITETDNALQVDQGFIKRLEQDTEQLISALKSSQNFIQEWSTSYTDAEKDLSVA